MLLSKLLLLPVAVASSVTVYVHSLPAPEDTAAPIPSPIPLATIDIDAHSSTATVSSFTPPTGAYTPDHLLRIGFTDRKSKSWRGVVTSAASFSEDYKKKFTVHVDEKGDPYHIGFGASANSGSDEVEVEVVKRGVGPKPVLNRPVVLNAEGKIDAKEPEKTFLQKYWWALALFILVQLVAGGKE